MRPFSVFVPSVNSNYASFGRACARGYANARGISIAEEEAGQQTLQVASCSQQLLLFLGAFIPGSLQRA